MRKKPKKPKKPSPSKSRGSISPVPSSSPVSKNSDGSGSPDSASTSKSIAQSTVLVTDLANSTSDLKPSTVLDPVSSVASDIATVVAHSGPSISPEEPAIAEVTTPLSSAPVLAAIPATTETIAAPSSMPQVSWVDHVKGTAKGKGQLLLRKGTKNVPFQRIRLWDRGEGKS
ncbi:unnamed protein product [Arabidopsis arenosa]|uniref:Uncharacterized protein n=1 Tax=Arabidopsis arenosa TaxID=38785 RepID=A0A8S2AVQ8_ARAAE|nr:unnamed protein product [Arabidopsis arenosa]